VEPGVVKPWVTTLGRVAGQVLNQQIPAGARESLSQWPTDEPCSVIASKELGLCQTMLGKEFPSTLTSMNNLAAVLRDQGNYEEAEEMYLHCHYYGHRSTHSPVG
jgi:hypothetical protein